MCDKQDFSISQLLSQNNCLVEEESIIEILLIYLQYLNLMWYFKYVLDTSLWSLMASKFFRDYVWTHTHTPTPPSQLYSFSFWIAYFFLHKFFFFTHSLFVTYYHCYRNPAGKASREVKLGLQTDCFWNSLVIIMK